MKKVLNYVKSVFMEDDKFLSFILVMLIMAIVCIIAFAIVTLN